VIHRAIGRDGNEGVLIIHLSSMEFPCPFYLALGIGASRNGVTLGASIGDMKML
jgi:hypothetical protein